jgi:glycosyltransferase involved in cell wall biosynthesis
MVAVPLRFGAGVKGKVLEALQNELPLVTTSIGAEGLPEADLVFNIYDDAQGFASALLDLENGDANRLRLRTHYREYLDRYFSKRRAADLLCSDFGEPSIQRELS